jgi:hypothetical protein
MHNEEPHRNLHESLDTLEQLVHSQTEQIRQLQHERDMLVAAHRVDVASLTQPRLR